MKLKTAKKNVKKALATLVKSGDINMKNIKNLMLLEKKNGIMGDEATKYRKTVFNPHNKEHNKNIDNYHISIDNLKMLVRN